MQSYSGYTSELAGWWEKEVSKEWDNYREEAMRVLQAEDELKNIVKLVGPEALPDRQRLILETYCFSSTKCAGSSGYILLAPKTIQNAKNNS